MSGNQNDEKYIRHCFELALKAEGRTAPNPIVGAVVVAQDGTIVGSGFHPQAGKPHAEVFALDQAGEEARGATLYVSLEPCCHHGKTPPCTDKIIASGVSKVVAAMLDPNPKVGGGGFSILRDAGIEVVQDILADEACWINRAFVKSITTGMPWLCLKIAATLDGKIADRYGKSQWITGDEARHFVHQMRSRLDCVLIGAGTARLDNPRLNVRGKGRQPARPHRQHSSASPEAEPFHPSPIRHPLRAAIDTNLTIPPDSHLCDPATGGNTIIYCSLAAQVRRGSLYPPTTQLVPVRCNRNLIDLEAVLKDLHDRGVRSALCEGGGKLAGSFIENNLVDEIFWIVAPAVIGDNKGVNSVESDTPVQIDQIKRYRFLDCRRLGDDVVIHLTRQVRSL